MDPPAHLDDERIGFDGIDALRTVRQSSLHVIAGPGTQDEYVGRRLRECPVWQWIARANGPVKWRRCVVLGCKRRRILDQGTVGQHVDAESARGASCGWLFCPPVVSPVPPRT